MGPPRADKREHTLAPAVFHLQCGEFRIQMRVSNKIFPLRVMK